MGRKFTILFVITLGVWASTTARAADRLQLNPKLDYNSDSQDGPLISGDNLGAGPVAGAVNYVIIYAEGCFNSKRQARRTVELYGKYQSRVNFVIVDLDRPRVAAQEPLIQAYFHGTIPQVVVLDPAGRPTYNQAGEASSEDLSRILDRLLDARNGER